MKTIDMLISEIKASEALQKLLADAVKNNVLDAFLKEQGVDVAAEEFIAALKAAAEQLDDDALDAVAGGANGREAPLSLITPGVTCPLQAICSTATSGTSNPKNGDLLCNG